MTWSGVVCEVHQRREMPCGITFPGSAEGSPAYINGFTARNMLSGVSMAKRPEYISQLRGPAAQSDTTGQK